MPTYDYVCDACGHEFDEFQSITAAPLRKCPDCNKLKLRRLIGTGAGIIFKGAGFYETDYRSESYKKGAEADKPKTDAGSGDSGKGTTDTPAKPAAETSKAASDSTPKPDAKPASGAKKPGGKRKKTA